MSSFVQDSDSGPLSKFFADGVQALRDEDPVLYGLVESELHRQQNTLAMVASCSTAHPSTLVCEGSFTSNVTAEGYPGARFHAGCVNVDQFEQLAIDRAKAAFGAQYANVQPHTASTANQVVMSMLLKPGDTLMGLGLDAGGHLSHGASVNLSGSFFNAVSYGLTEEGVLDYEQAEAVAMEHRPKLIICGTTAYARTLNWERFREIADKVGAYLLADITHIAGLVIAGEHPSPIDVAHVTTTCTHKQLYGPRGGLILMGKDVGTLGPDGKTPLEKLFQRGIFPFLQGAPIVNSIVAKARALDRSMTPEFKEVARSIVELSRSLAASWVDKGVRVISGGTDNHIVVVDVFTSYGVTGIVAERALEECHIIVNKNRIVGDQKSPRITSGMRLGTNSMAARGLNAEDAKECADIIHDLLSGVSPVSDTDYTIPEDLRLKTIDRVTAICHRYPLKGYPVPHAEGAAS